jgi:hypothetical protein
MQNENNIWIITNFLTIKLSEIRRIERQRKDVQSREIPTFDFATSQPIKIKSKSDEKTSLPLKYNLITVDNVILELTHEEYNIITLQLTNINQLFYKI